MAERLLKRVGKTSKYRVRFHYEDRFFSTERDPCDFLDNHAITAVLGFDFLNECFLLVRVRLADNTHELALPKFRTPSEDSK